MEIKRSAESTESLQNSIIKALPEVEKYCRKSNIYSEDLISEVKVSALESTYTNRGNKITSWLIGIAKNKHKVNKYERKRNPISENISENECKCFQCCNFDEEIINRIISNNKAVKLRIEGYNVGEIADEMKLKKSTVKTRISKFRRAFNENRLF